MSFDDWALALHVVSAFALVAGIVCFWVITVAARSADTPEATLRLGPVAQIAGAAIGIGMGGTIILGIWLAFSVAATTSGIPGLSRRSSSGCWQPPSAGGRIKPPSRPCGRRRSCSQRAVRDLIPSLRP